VVRSALLHAGPGRLLVHRLKYQGLVAAARVLAQAMAPLLDPPPPALVPVPRALLRRLAYGVDPGPELAGALGGLVGIPVADGLRAGLWHRRRAGPAQTERGKPRLRAAGEVPAGSVLVDDVITTGLTLTAAAAVVPGIAGAVTATAAPSAITREVPPGTSRRWR
jgi:predicted amidophosphoribosyltransferase